MINSVAALHSLALVAPQSFFTTEALRRYSALYERTAQSSMAVGGTTSPWWSMRLVSTPTTKLREVGEVGEVLGRHFGDSSVGHFHVSDVPARKSISVLYASGA